MRPWGAPLTMTANRAWLYPILVGLFVAFIAVLLQYGDERFGQETVVERQAITNAAASADSPPPPAERRPRRGRFGARTLRNRLPACFSSSC